ncbi:hypothetical protein [Adhaeribacter soli]|uniref:Uncharacterized protein n=1 Tax=Adhaeribacter soli TaxID=2607655 RepID=A0A5N1ISA2_9BACT|nr:hypothetical protein [Adhaeribacter soli]KAA9327389.1 hypothetical protein F0P94_15860 [Adhaeribacter soli]
MKNLIKKSIYSFYPKDSLKPYKLKLGYIFHTEQIYDDTYFSWLLEFCSTYYEITGARAICAIIPPTNYLLAQSLKEAGFSESNFVSRLRDIEKVATLGYHGHFYNSKTPKAEFAIHCNSFQLKPLIEQVEADLNWFRKHNIDHNGIYSGGWWFMNAFLADMLITNGFRFDYTFSRAPYFFNLFSDQIMSENQVRIGESFYLESGKGKMLCIQNFIGAHATPYVEDFDRNLKNLFSPENENGLNVGVINSHDYDLDLKNTLKCIRHLVTDAGAEFFSHDGLRALSEQQARKTALLDLNK